MSSGETPFYAIIPPPIISSFNQQTVGPLEIDGPPGFTALKVTGNVMLKDNGKISTDLSTNVPAISFNGSVVSVSSTDVSVNGGLRFLNTSVTQGHQGLRYIEGPAVNLPSGTIYISEVVAAGGVGNVLALCVAP